MSTIFEILLDTPTSSVTVTGSLLDSGSWEGQFNTLGVSAIDYSHLLVYPSGTWEESCESLGAFTASFSGSVQFFESVEMSTMQSFATSSMSGNIEFVEGFAMSTFQQVAESNDMSNDGAITHEPQPQFPAITQQVIPQKKTLDETRYQKGYSFVRTHPVRIRKFRNR